MLTNRQDTQVLDPVVAGVTVDVVDLLPSLKPSSDVLFDYPSVFKDASTVHRDPSVRPMLIGPLTERVAGLRAEALFDAARTPRELFAALRALLIERGEVAWLFPFDGSKPRLVDAGQFGLAETTPRTKPDVELSEAVRADIKSHATELAHHVHATIVPQKQAVAIALNTQRQAKKRK